MLLPPLHSLGSFNSVFFNNMKPLVHNRKDLSQRMLSLRKISPGKILSEYAALSKLHLRLHRLDALLDLVVVEVLTSSSARAG